MTQQIINVGSAANDGTGDPLRTAFNKINTNFTELYSRGAAGSDLDISGNEIAAINSNGNIELVPNGSGTVVIVNDTLMIAESRTPASIGSSGDKAGMLAWDSNYLYICTADYDGSTTIWNQLSAGAAYDLILSTDASNSISTASNANINLTPNGTGKTVIKNITTANAIVSSIATGTAPFTVESTTQVANLNVATAGTAGTVTTAAQPNITSVGTLTSLTTSGDVTIGGDVTISGNDIKSSSGNVAITLSNQDVTVKGNLTIQGISTTVGTQDLTIEDSIVNLHTFANLAALTSDDGRDIGIKFHYYKSSDKHAFVGWANDSSALEYYVDATESAGVISGTYGDIKANRFISNIATGTAPFTVNSTTQVANLNAATAGTAGTVTTAAQPNITSHGTLTALDVNAQANATIFKSNIATGTAPLIVTSTTQVANLNVATAGTAGTVITAAQPNITSVGTLSSVTVGAGTTSVAPINLTSGTNLTSATAGSFEWDGTTLNFTPSSNYGRASLGALIYTSGTGTSLTPTATGEATNQALFPSAGDTITLPIGTYHITLQALVTRGATSTTSATARINLGGGGTAVGTFSGYSTSSVAAGGAASQFVFNGVALTVDNVVTAANAAAAGVYNIYLSGVLRITTAGTFIPKYSLSAALTGATTATAPSALNYLMIQQIATSGSAAATGGWA